MPRPGGGRRGIGWAEGARVVRSMGEGLRSGDRGEALLHGCGRLGRRGAAALDGVLDARAGKLDVLDDGAGEGLEVLQERADVLLDTGAGLARVALDRLQRLRAATLE